MERGDPLPWHCRCVDVHGLRVGEESSLRGRLGRAWQRKAFDPKNKEERKLLRRRMER